MEYFQYALLAIISYFGLFFGVLLALNSPEELKDNKKNFVLIKYLMLILACFGFFFYGLPRNYVLSFLSLFFLIYYVFTHNHNKDIFAYAFFSILFYSFPNLVVLTAILFFGFAEGSLVRYSLRNKHLKEAFGYVIKNYWVFLFLALLFPFILT